MVIKKEKRIYSNSGAFELKADPNDWNKRDVEHMARLILRAVGKHPISSIEYKGIHEHNRVSIIQNGRIITNSAKIHTNSSWARDDIDKFMLFELNFEKKVPRTTRKNNLNDIINQLIIECI